MEALTQRHIEVDVLVNNAGFGAHGPIAEISVERQLDMIEVNVAALTRLTALLLPGMLERRRGAILNVASTAAFQPGPYQAVYCATKAYVLSFTSARSPSTGETTPIAPGSPRGPRPRRKGRKPRPGRDGRPCRGSGPSRRVVTTERW